MDWELKKREIYQLVPTSLVTSQSSHLHLFKSFFIIQMKNKVEPERAKAIGRLLFQKYDLGKRGALGPKQCYEIFSDFCYRILAINPQPTMEEANSMFEILDENKDKRVTESDFENLAVKYLCQSGPSSGFSSSNFYTSTVTQNSQVSGNNQTSSSKFIKTSGVQSSNSIKYSEAKAQSSGKKLTVIARKRIDVVRRLFKIFDKDENGYLTEEQIPFILQETYREMGQNYQPTKDDIKSYMKMVDTDGDGKITLGEFEEIILRSLKNAGFEIYQ